MILAAGALASYASNRDAVECGYTPAFGRRPADEAVADEDDPGHRDNGWLARGLVRFRGGAW